MWYLILAKFYLFRLKVLNESTHGLKWETGKTINCFTQKICLYWKAETQIKWIYLNLVDPKLVASIAEVWAKHSNYLLKLRFELKSIKTLENINFQPCIRTINRKYESMNGKHSLKLVWGHLLQKPFCGIYAELYTGWKLKYQIKCVHVGAWIFLLRCGSAESSNFKAFQNWLNVFYLTKPFHYLIMQNFAMATFTKPNASFNLLLDMLKILCSKIFCWIFPLNSLTRETTRSTWQGSLIIFTFLSWPTFSALSLTFVPYTQLSKSCECSKLITEISASVSRELSRMKGGRKEWWKKRNF